MQIQDQPHIGVLGADPAAITQFLRRVQALGGEHAVLLPLSPAAVPDCEPYLCGASTQPPLPKLRAAAEVLAASGCTVIAAPDSAGVFCEEITAAVGIPTLGVSGPALQQLVGKLLQRASVLCTPGVRAANGYGIAARRYGLYCSYPDAPVQALLGCVQPEKACSEQVLRSIIELELARGNDSVVLDSAQLCAAFAHFGLAARYPQAADGMELLDDSRPVYDILFLDVEMKHLDGMETARRVRELDKDVIIVFITNMAQYAIGGYAVGALDYVLKPVPYFAFSQQLRKAEEQLRRRARHYLALPVEGGMRRLDSSLIYYLESEGHRVHFYTEEGDFVAAGTLKAFEEKLAERPFARCNSGYLVNLAQVKSVQQGMVQVGPYELQVSRPRRKAFLAALADHIGGEGA